MSMRVTARIRIRSPQSPEDSPISSQAWSPGSPNSPIRRPQNALLCNDPVRIRE